MTLEKFAADLYARLNRKEIPGLNGLRALAVFAVILGHYGYDNIFRAGEGVTLFFVLSGFLITWLLLKEDEKNGEISLKNFYARRTLRIFPAFYVFWVFAILLTVYAHQHVYVGHAASAAGYYSNYYFAFSHKTIDALDHTWSLSVEEQFYLLWPASFLLLRRLKINLVSPLVAVIVSVWIYRTYAVLVLHAPDRYVYHVFHARADHLLIGCLLAVVLFERRWLAFWQLISRPVFLIVSVLAFAFAMQIPIGTYRFVFGYIIYPLIFAVLLVQCVVNGRWLDWRPIRYIGLISYPLYLYHMPVGMVANHFLKQKPHLVQVAIGIPLMIFVASCSYYFVEKPALKFKARFQGQPAERSAKLATAATAV